MSLCLYKSVLSFSLPFLLLPSFFFSLILRGVYACVHICLCVQKRELVLTVLGPKLRSSVNAARAEPSLRSLPAVF